MIIVREVFIAKPGMASKLARLMKSVMKEVAGARTTIMTDLTGQFNKVVVATEFDNLQAFENRMKDYGQNPGLRDRMMGYTEMYLYGKREVYQVVE